MPHHATSVILSILMGAALVWADANAAEIKVLSSAAVKEAYVAIVPQFERQTGHKVFTVWDGTVNIGKRIGSGEVFDIVIILPTEIERLASEGKLVGGSRTDFVKSGIGIAVRAGTSKPDISSGEAVKNAVLAAKSVAYSSGPSGAYIAGLLQKMGIAEQIKGRVIQAPRECRLEK